MLNSTDYWCLVLCLSGSGYHRCFPARPTAYTVQPPVPCCLLGAAISWCIAANLSVEHAPLFPCNLQAIYAYVTLMEGMGHPPDDPEAVRKQLVVAVRTSSSSQTRMFI